MFSLGFRPHIPVLSKLNTIPEGRTYSALVAPLILTVLARTFIPNLTIANLVLGIVSMLFIPGFLLDAVACLGNHPQSRLGFSIIFGILIQLGNVFALYVVDSFARFGQFNFPLYLLLLTAFETISLIFLSKGRKVATLSKEFLDFAISVKSAPSLLFAISVAGNLIFQSYNSAALFPDGGLYLDVARYLVSNGAFSSLVINDGWRYPFQNQSGLSLNIGTSLLYSLFFSMGGVSYQIAKYGASMIGALLIYPVFEITRLSFGNRAALISASVIAAHPLFRYYSAILFGPEIASTLLALSSMLLMYQAVSTRNLRYSIVSGILLFMSNFIWGGDTVPLVGAFVLMLTFGGLHEKRNYLELSVRLVATSLLFGVFLFALASSPNVFLWIATLVGIAGIILLYRFLKVANLKYMAAISMTYLGLMQLYLLRFYMVPSAVYLYEPRKPYFATDIYYIAAKFADYVWPNWNAASLTIVLIPALLSILWISKKSTIPISFLLAWLLARLLLLPTPADLYIVLEDRFYLSITAVFVILFAGFLIQAVIQASANRKISVGIRRLSMLRALSSSRVRTAILTSIFIILVLGASLPSYTNYLTTFTTDSAQANGWTPLLDWIHTNSSSSDILLTTGAPRLWAWFAARQVVGTNVFENGSLLPVDQIGPAEFGGLVLQFSAKFVIFDSTFGGALLRLTKLNYLYGNLQQGTIFVISSGSRTITLQVIVSATSNVSNGTVTLYRITT